MIKVAKKAGNLVKDIKEFTSGAVKKAKIIAKPIGGMITTNRTMNKAGNHCREYVCRRLESIDIIISARSFRIIINKKHLYHSQNCKSCL